MYLDTYVVIVDIDFEYVAPSWDHRKTHVFSVEICTKVKQRTDY